MKKRPLINGFILSLILSSSALAHGAEEETVESWTDIFHLHGDQLANNWPYILLMLACGFLLGLIYRSLMKSLFSSQSRGASKNINARGRWLRGILGVVLILIASQWSWHPLFLVLSGFCLFEAIFSWCGFYAMIGKNSCRL